MAISLSPNNQSSQYAVSNYKDGEIYLLLTKHKGCTGGISARGLWRYGPGAVRAVQKRSKTWFSCSTFPRKLRKEERFITRPKRFKKANDHGLGRHLKRQARIFYALNWALPRMTPWDHSCVFSGSFIGYFPERTHLNARKRFLRPTLFRLFSLHFLNVWEEKIRGLISRLKFVVSFQSVIVAFFFFQNFFSRGINILLTKLARDCTCRISKNPRKIV